MTHKGMALNERECMFLFSKVRRRSWAFLRVTGMAWLGYRPICLFDSPSSEGLRVLPLFAAWDIWKTRYLFGAFFSWQEAGWSVCVLFILFYALPACIDG